MSLVYKNSYENSDVPKAPLLNISEWHYNMLKNCAIRHILTQKTIKRLMRIGVDEAGKGDYFGYLVIAGVAIDESNEKSFRQMGVADSKRLGDSRVKELSKLIKKTCVYDIVKISPQRYNSLYPRFQSLNKMLAWGHAQVIENLLEKKSCDEAVTDKFADDKFLNNALKEKGKKIKIIQKINGESDIAVAAASILARDEFLKTLRQLGRMVGMVLPKGAGDVEKTARELIEKYDPKILDETAKVHFKITKKILGE